MSAQHDTDGRRELVRLVARKQDGTASEWTQKRIADALKVSQPSVSGWVRGTSRPEPEYREALHHLLGIPVEAWFTRAERKVVERVRDAAQGSTPSQPGQG